MPRVYLLDILFKIVFFIFENIVKSLKIFNDVFNYQAFSSFLQDLATYIYDT